VTGKKINHIMIVLARESRGITQAQLAKLANVSQGKISKIEHGLQNASMEIISKLENVLNYPKEFFYESGQIFPPKAFCTRKRSSLSQKHHYKITALLNIYRMHIQKLLRSAELNVNVPNFDLDEFEENPKKIASAVRHYWQMPCGPVENVTKIIEDAGIFIIHCEFGTSLIDGLSINQKDSPPIIFVNKEIPGDRLRFTLSHELGHIIMHRFPTPTMEDEANSFASEFLMPAKEIKSSLTRLSLEKLASLKPYWKVSMASLLMQASDLNKINERQKRYLWMQMGKLGYRRREPEELDIPIEKSSLIDEIISLHIDELGYNIQDLSKSLTLFQDEFRAKYLNQTNHLRLLRSG